MCALGIVRGYPDNTVRPVGGATRAEAVTMLLRLEDAMAAMPEPEPEPPAEEPAPETSPEPVSPTPANPMIVYF